MSSRSQLYRRLIAYVGTRNRVKLLGVRRALKKVRVAERIIIKACDPPPCLPPQPVGLPSTVRGAVVRALHSLRGVRSSRSDVVILGVGVEAGLIPLRPSITGFLDLQVCAIVDVEERVTIGVSTAFEFPPVVVEKVLSGEVEESESVFEEISGVKDIGELMGAIGYLTRGAIDRLELTEHAVIAAMIPRLNEALYRPSSWPRVDEVLRSL